MVLLIIEFVVTLSCVSLAVNELCSIKCTKVASAGLANVPDITASTQKFIDDTRTLARPLATFVIKKCCFFIESYRHSVCLFYK